MFKLLRGPDGIIIYEDVIIIIIISFSCSDLVPD